MTENLQKELKEIIVAISVIVGTMVIYHVLAIQTNILSSFFKYLPYVLRPPFVLFSSGILAAIMYRLFTKNTAKILLISMITIVLWIYWFSAIYPALIYD
ncbi:hypothetical protein ACSAZL_08030 [Methanosarcina sp. T3]|uniref:hypothetical protein n=1 Tax=Methanosarcina sp. T3 TaxID=3439062 RepID=UPI003F848A72